MAWWFPPSKPRKVKGGIRSHSKRGDFGKSWWAKRWNMVLDGFDIGERMSRGRSYLRKGQITSIDIQKGVVISSVQGSDRYPYNIKINIKPLSAAAWRKITPILFSKPATAAKLLTGQMPEDVEKIFDDAGILLFPTQKNDLQTDCTCYDWSNPCKHIVAVYLLIGEELDRDPFLIFRLRGADKKEILDMAGLGSVDREQRGVTKAKTFSSKNIPIELDKFWGRNRTQEHIPVNTDAISVHAALPKWLGNFQFWRGSRDFMPSLETMYDHASSAEMSIFADENQDEGPGTKRTQKSTSRQKRRRN